MKVGDSLEGRVRLAATLMIVGLTVELGTLFWVHPMSFSLFLALGAVPIVAGAGLYLLAILRYGG